MSAHPSPAPPHTISSLSSVPGAARAPRWLFSRDLVGSGYAETYTAANGSQVTEQLQRQVWPQCSCPGPAAGAGSRARERGPHTLLLQDHCFYQGHVEGHPHSAASLSTCAGLRWVLQAGRPSPSRGVIGAQEEGVPGATASGPQPQSHPRLCLRGFFQAGPAVRLIEPLAGAGEEGPHALYLAQHLQQEAGTCGVNDSSLESILGPRVSAAFRPRVSGGPTLPTALLGPARPQAVGC